VPLQRFIFESKFCSTFGQDSDLFKKLIVVDLKRDLKKLQQEDPSVTLKGAIREHYSIGKVLNWGMLAYTQTHLYKALCQMSNHPDCYTPYLQDVAYWSSYDPTFTLAGAIMALNYQLL